MSLSLEDEGKQSEIEDVLEQILVQIKLLNLRIEEAFNTGITEEDV